MARVGAVGDVPDFGFLGGHELEGVIAGALAFIMS